MRTLKWGSELKTRPLCLSSVRGEGVTFGRPGFENITFDAADSSSQSTSVVRVYDTAYLRGLGNTTGFTESTSVLAHGIANAITFDKACLSDCAGRGKGDVSDRTSDDCLRTAQQKNL